MPGVQAGHFRFVSRVPLIKTNDYSLYIFRMYGANATYTAIAVNSAALYAA